MTNNLLTIGLIVVFIGVFLIIIGSITQAKQSKTTAKVAIGGFIGPIPFGFFNDKAMFYVLIGLMAFMMVLWFILRTVGAS